MLPIPKVRTSKADKRRVFLGVDLPNLEGLEELGGSEAVSGEELDGGLRIG